MSHSKPDASSCLAALQWWPGWAASLARVVGSRQRSQGSSSSGHGVWPGGLLGGSIISHRTQASPEAGMLGEPVYLTLTSTVLSSGDATENKRDSGPALKEVTF